jgi:predicted PhzF superfamily epimerase YddE/YHI9
VQLGDVRTLWHRLWNLQPIDRFNMQQQIRRYPFSQVDVFTDHVFGGNPLAVFLSADGLSDAEMQAIANEMNLSETVFVLPSQNPDCLRRLRIFTPKAELPLRNRLLVDRALLDVRKLLACAIEPEAEGAFLFAPDGEPGENRVYSRMLDAGKLGIREDPATGSASGVLGAYMVKYGLITATGLMQILSEQGTKMGRQSFIHIRVESSGDHIESIEVGGSVVPVLEGIVHLPETPAGSGSPYRST